MTTKRIIASALSKFPELGLQTNHCAFGLLKKAALGLSLLYVVPGCTTAPLGPVNYTGSVQVETQRAAIVEYEPGVVTGGSGISAEGPYPKLFFGDEDQLVFVESLTAELNRIGLLNAVREDAQPARENAVRIQIMFMRTFHDPDDQNYILDVWMYIAGEKHDFSRTYQVKSHDSFWDSLLFTASGEKKKAAERLMNLLIDDIAEWAIDEKL
jgi:hypothetical protein